MRTPQVILVAGLMLLFVLLITPQRHPYAYNAAREQTISGVVEEVRDFYCPVNGAEGDHLIVATDTGRVLVHVAPVRFLDSQQLRFSVGDRVEVVGANVMFQGHQDVIARAIIRNGKTVPLRKDNGMPMWAE